MPAKGTAEWRGDVPTGTGTFTAGDSISGGLHVQVPLRGWPWLQPRATDRRSACGVLLDGTVEHPRQGGHPARVDPNRGRCHASADRGCTHDHQDRVVDGRNRGRHRRGHLHGTRHGGKGRMPGQQGSRRRARDHLGSAPRRLTATIRATASAFTWIAISTSCSRQRGSDESLVRIEHNTPADDRRHNL